MKLTSESYTNASGVESAIKQAASQAAKNNTSLDKNKLIQMEYFNRFLSRVFSDGDDSEWVLKGGTGILARVPSTRSTTDVDLTVKSFTLDQALEQLKKLAQVDLGDHFRFEYVTHEPIISSEAQPYTYGYSVIFNVFIGTNRKNNVKVDLAAGAGITDEVTTLKPEGALNLPKLTSNPYRVYPVVDQIADKVCATMNQYPGSFSSREKDLVDIVVLAKTQEINGSKLSHAISSEIARRQMETFTNFVVPKNWGDGYARQSRQVPHCENFRKVEQAAELAAKLINPALDGNANGKKWSPVTLTWQ